MKIACVCAMGLGSSLILRMTVETALKQLHMKDVEVVDPSTARGSQADIIVSSHSFCEQLSDMGVAMIEVVNYTDANYIKEQLQKILSAQ